MAGWKKKWFGLAALGAAIAGIVARMRRREASEGTEHEGAPDERV
jgi:hypothetical protein